MRRLILAVVAIALAGFGGGVWTATVYLPPPAGECMQKKPRTQLETDLTFPVTPEFEETRSRHLNPSFL